MKFLNKKRVASAALAGALALSMAAPAFASQSVITGNYKEIRLAVTVPTTGKAVINPYGLPIALSETHNISGQGISNAAPLTVQNRSAVPLNVNVSITSAPLADSTFTFETTGAIGASEKGNKGLVKFEMFRALGLTEATLADEDALIGGFAALDSADALPANGVQLKGLAGTPDAATNILTLRESDAEGNLQAGGAAYFRLTGEAVKAPATPWKATDGFTATIAFTFEPSTTAYALNAGTLAFDTAADQNAIPGAPGTGLTLSLDGDLPADFTATAQNVTWSVDDTTNFTITQDTTNPLKAKIKMAKTSGIAANTPVNITVTVTDANGVPFTATIAGQAAGN